MRVRGGGEEGGVGRRVGVALRHEEKVEGEWVVIVSDWMVDGARAIDLRLAACCFALLWLCWLARLEDVGSTKHLFCLFVLFVCFVCLAVWLFGFRLLEPRAAAAAAAAAVVSPLIDVDELPKYNAKEDKRHVYRASS